MEIILRRHWAKTSSAAVNGDPEAQWELGYFHQFGAKDKSGNVLATPNVTTAMKWYQASSLRAIVDFKAR
jgi:TPR repeat protein